MYEILREIHSNVSQSLDFLEVILTIGNCSLLIQAFSSNLFALHKHRKSLPINLEILFAKNEKGIAE